jgi:hypothetical protein
VHVLRKTIGFPMRLLGLRDHVLHERLRRNAPLRCGKGPFLRQPWLRVFAFCALLAAYKV